MSCALVIESYCPALMFSRDNLINARSSRSPDCVWEFLCVGGLIQFSLSKSLSIH